MKKIVNFEVQCLLPGDYEAIAFWDKTKAPTVDPSKPNESMRIEIKAGEVLKGVKIYCRDPIY